jgi:hypothetical protein
MKFYTFTEIAYMTGSNVDSVYYYYYKERVKIVSGKCNLNRPKRLNFDGIMIIIPYFKDPAYVESFKKYYNETGEIMPKGYGL